MAKNDVLDAGEKVRLLRALAFQIHRKRAADEVLDEYLIEQFQKGRRREYRPAADALAASGFVAALQSLTLVGAEAAILLTAILGSSDHRLMAAALTSLADWQETSGGGK